MTLGEKLQILRTDAGLSQEELAERLSVSRQAVSKWERNQAAPDVKYIVALSDLFSVTTDYLLKDLPPEDLPPEDFPLKDLPPEDPAAPSPPPLFADRASGLPVWDAGLTACRIVILGNTITAALLGTWLFLYFSGILSRGLFFLVLSAILPPVLTALAKLLLEGAAASSRLLRRFQRAIGLSAALWGFALSLLLGFHEVLGDTLLDRVGGLPGVLAGILLTAGLLGICYTLGIFLARRMTHPPEE